MPSLLGTNPTLADWAKEQDPSGNTAKVVSLLSQTNAMVEDGTVLEGNLPTGHREVIETGLPESYWRGFNQHIPTSTGTSAQVDFGVGLQESIFEVDVELAKLNGNDEMWLLQRSKRYIESMTQGMAQATCYGNIVTNPEQFQGFAAAYSSLSGPNRQNILSAGGTTNLTSMYLVVWGEDTVFYHFPKGSVAGLQVGPMEEYWSQTSGRRLRVLGKRFTWKQGLCIRDWRYVVRICNIDTAALKALSGTQALTAPTNIIRLILNALDIPPALDAGRAVLYCNRTVRQALSVHAMERSQNVLSINEGARQPKLGMLGTQIRIMDRLRNDEAVVA